MNQPAFLPASPVVKPTSRSSFNALDPQFKRPFFGQSIKHAPCRIPTSTRTSSRSLHSPAMSLSKVVIAGGTGFIGTYLTKALLKTGAAVTILTRQNSPKLPSGATFVQWNPTTSSDSPSSWQSTLANADLVVNLSGNSILSRWDAAGRDRIIQSRIKPTAALVSAIRSLPPEQRPACFVNTSAIGYYGESDSQVFDENSPAAADFLADLCVQWENTAQIDVPETRLVIIRTGVVLGAGGGAMASMVPIFKLFLGGPLGTGRQWVSWVHVDDLAAAFVLAGQKKDMAGTYNGVAPNPVRMSELCSAVGRALGRPSLFPVPEFVVKAALGGASSVLLEGGRVSSKRLVDAGFQFQYPDIDSATNAIAAQV